MSITVRGGRPGDLDQLVAFNAALARETEDLALDEERLRQGIAAVLADGGRGHYHLAERDGRVVGALAITTEWSDWRAGWWWWIQSVYVRAEARGQGVYRALHEHVRSEAAAAGDVCGLRLLVEPENTRAQAVYRAMGMDLGPYHLFETDEVVVRAPRDGPAAAGEA